MKKVIFVIFIYSVMFLSGCAGKQEKIEQDSTKELFAMDTYMTITAYGKNAQKAVEQAEEKIMELDAKLSIGSHTSEVSALNDRGSATLSQETGYLLEESLNLWEQTDGAFNPAIYPVMEAWGFPSKEYKVPDEETLNQKLKLIDASKISFSKESGNAEFEEEGMKIDFGGIAKGYTSSVIMDIFKQNKIQSGMVSLGGNVQVYGSKPDGSSWRVGIQSPDDGEDYIGVLEVKNKAVITSGGYERYFETNGKKYHHIIDSATGYPAESGLKSVTIVSDDGTLADGLSTALFVMGLDKAQTFWKNSGYSFDVIFLTDEDKLYITEGIEKIFTTDLEYVTIRKEE